MATQGTKISEMPELNEVTGNEYIPIQDANGNKKLKTDKIGKPINTVVVEGATPTQELKPNTFYEFGEVTSLTITLAAEIPNVYNEYAFQFISGATATTLNMPSEIKWLNSTPLIVEANKTYEVSIVNNLAVGGAF